jgi:metal-responsive CopG/Arc/MetJ family transcriptional regulator
MRVSCNLTLPYELVQQIDKLRGREKRSTFAEHLLRLGLKVYLEELNEQKKV